MRYDYDIHPTFHEFEKNKKKISLKLHKMLIWSFNLITKKLIDHFDLIDSNPIILIDVRSRGKPRPKEFSKKRKRVKEVIYESDDDDNDDDEDELLYKKEESKYNDVIDLITEVKSIDIQVSPDTEDDCTQTSVSNIEKTTQTNVNLIHMNELQQIIKQHLKEIKKTEMNKENEISKTEVKKDTKDKKCKEVSIQTTIENIDEKGYVRITDIELDQMKKKTNMSVTIGSLLTTLVNYKVLPEHLLGQIFHDIVIKSYIDGKLFKEISSILRTSEKTFLLNCIDKDFYNNILVHKIIDLDYES